MERLEALEADRAVELVEDAVEVAGYVIAAIPHMAGIEADAERIGAAGPLYDAGELLEGTPDLGSLARHGLEQDGRAHFGKERFV